jgi:hypothetical protein
MVECKQETRVCLIFISNARLVGCFAHNYLQINKVFNSFADSNQSIAFNKPINQQKILLK